MSTSQPMGTAAKLVFGKSADISQKVPVDNPTVREQKSWQPTSGLKRIIQHSHAIGIMQVLSVSEGDSSGASSEGRKLSHFQVSIVSMALAPSLSVAISCPTVKFLMVVGMIVHFHDVGTSCVVPSALNPKP
jgi:hypothetical protein